MVYTRHALRSRRRELSAIAAQGPAVVRHVIDDTYGLLLGGGESTLRVAWLPNGTGRPSTRQLCDDELRSLVVADCRENGTDNKHALLCIALAADGNLSVARAAWRSATRDLVLARIFQAVTTHLQTGATSFRAPDNADEVCPVRHYVHPDRAQARFAEHLGAATGDWVYHRFEHMFHSARVL